MSRKEIWLPNLEEVRSIETIGQLRDFYLSAPPVQDSLNLKDVLIGFVDFATRGLGGDRKKFGLCKRYGKESELERALFRSLDLWMTARPSLHSIVSNNMMIAVGGGYPPYDYLILLQDLLLSLCPDANNADLAKDREKIKQQLETRPWYGPWFELLQSLRPV
ncbi:MAG: hypothetical protein AAB505_00195 [Patescibacteria group bacterium]